MTHSCSNRGLIIYHMIWVIISLNNLHPLHVAIVLERAYFYRSAHILTPVKFQRILTHALTTHTHPHTHTLTHTHTNKQTNNHTCIPYLLLSFSFNTQFNAILEFCTRLSLNNYPILSVATRLPLYSVVLISSKWGVGSEVVGR